MSRNKLLLAAFSLVAFAGVVFAQNGSLPFYPIVGGAAYCSATNNNSCTNTVPAGPTALTGSENFVAATNLSGGRSPQMVLVKPASLNSLPMTWVTVAHATPANISASSVQGGLFYIATETITSAAVTLPLGAIDNQQFVLSANRTITSLGIFAPAGDTLGNSAAPTVLTASTTTSFGYRWVYHGSTKVWQRIQ